MVKPSETSPGYTFVEATKKRRIAEFWNGWRIGRYTGGPNREELEAIERQVTDCLYAGDLAKAERLTAKAMLLTVPDTL